jgi:nucleolar protein 56
MQVKKEKKAKFKLGVLDSKIGNSIQSETGIPCTTADPVPELIRGIRLHFGELVAP